MGIELAYINTKHPDFAEAGLVHRALTDGLREDMHRMKLQDQTNKQQDENRVRFDRKFKKSSSLMAYFHCRTRIQIQTWTRIPNPMVR